ncbi:hypothetical protein [Thermococcus thioreducens]|uniref:Uncharacterized protein n=1 Tax=Thermococcus thioreducens TaxID=277988 RepID=A0A0Q2M507_9EURY|nr:hypothetical protein [Thermococcus thioreducens]ASJ12374.1 hypothetical protein A3L14_05470 [Thermococcus thioreducens]KQH83105.1 hypothetical protein AMR53_02475 [Thermococcus thioreducens]SEV91950.1 hypothetical protein SAMN05216170_0864 [Thermococcus thioreducens]
MIVEIRAVPEDNDPKECIKRAALDALVDETVRVPGKFTSALFHPGPWERFKECARPKASVEFSAGGLFIARGEEDYLRFAEGILSIGALARGRFMRTFQLAELTGTPLLADPLDDGIRLSFAGFYGAVVLSPGEITFSTEDSAMKVPLGDFLRAEEHFLSSLAFDLGELFEVCSKHGLERAFLENTRPVRLLLKVVGYENRLEY